MWVITKIFSTDLEKNLNCGYLSFCRYSKFWITKKCGGLKCLVRRLKIPSCIKLFLIIPPSLGINDRQTTSFHKTLYCTKGISILISVWNTNHPFLTYHWTFSTLYILWESKNTRRYLYCIISVYKLHTSIKFNSQLGKCLKQFTLLNKCSNYFMATRLL